jgi:hypothetical protein
VSVRATTAAVTVVGGAPEVSARLLDPEGREAPGLVVEHGARGTLITLVASVKPGSRIEARVPSATDLRVAASNGGPVTVREVRGLLEIANSNAAIVLERVGGSVVASTSNGPIEATVVSVDAGLPLSFLTSNGAIDVTLPQSLRADLRLESDTGPVTTEFALSPIGGQAVEQKLVRGGRLRTVVAGAVNGGGPPVTLRTENNRIRVRRGS